MRGANAVPRCVGCVRMSFTRGLTHREFRGFAVPGALVPIQCTHHPRTLVANSPARFVPLAPPPPPTAPPANTTSLCDAEQAGSPPQLPPKDTCCFCRRREDDDVPHRLAGLLVATDQRATPLQYHEACAAYSSAIAYGRRLTASQPREPYRHGDIPANKVDLEFSRGRHIRCSLCGQPGATVNCKGIAACGCVWHLPCARGAAQSTGDVSFSASALEAACKKHANM